MFYTVPTIFLLCMDRAGGDAASAGVFQSGSHTVDLHIMLNIGVLMRELYLLSFAINEHAPVGVNSRIIMNYTITSLLFMETKLAHSILAYHAAFLWQTRIFQATESCDKFFALAGIFPNFPSSLMDYKVILRDIQVMATEICIMDNQIREPAILSYLDITLQSDDLTF